MDGWVGETKKNEWDGNVRQALQRQFFGGENV